MRLDSHLCLSFFSLGNNFECGTRGIAVREDDDLSSFLLYDSLVPISPAGMSSNAIP